MAYSLNDKIKNLAPYYPIEGNYSVRLDANESFLHLSDDMLEKFKHEIDRLAFNRYPDPVASRAVKAFASYNNINPKLVTAGNGSDELISIIINAFLMKGEVVLTTSPDFSMYAFYSQLAENTIEVYEKDENFEIDIDKLILKAAETKARMIIFSNPCNPTTLGIKKSDVKKLIALTDALVVIDEAYMDFWDQSVLDCVEQYDNLIVLKTCSKAISAAAIRLGFAVACKTLTTAIRAVKSPYNMNALTNIAGEIIYSDPRYLIRWQSFQIKWISEFMIQRQTLF